MGKNSRRRAEPQRRPFVSPACPLPGRQAKPEKLDESLVAMEAADSAEFVGFRTPTPAIQRLVRIVAALPLHQFMPLNHAFAKAKSCLGSGDLAAHDLWKRARDGQLTIAARQIFPDGTEQVLILRRAYWQYFVILPPYSDSEVVLVRGSTILPGAWHLFVRGGRRFDRFYLATEAKAARIAAEQVRAELEQARTALQAVTERMEKAEARAAEARVETATDNSERRRPGTKPKYPEWRVDAAVFIHRFSRKEKRKPGVGEIAAYLQETFGWEPDEKDIRDLLKYLIRD